MGLYQRWVLPRLLELAMRQPVLEQYRKQAIAGARGVVLEIGVGSGLNLALYGPAVERVCAIDPAPELLRLANQRIGQAVVPVSLVQASAERLPFADAVFDTVVMTWTLCSIVDPVAALIEMRRVLKRQACLLFVEHGLSSDYRVARWQHGLTPGWRRLAGGCHLDRRIDELIRAAGFRLDALETDYMTGPKPWTYLYQGRASP